MSGGFRPYSYEIYYSKNRRGVQFPHPDFTPEKRKKAPGFPECPARAEHAQSPAVFRQSRNTAGQAHRSAPHKIPHKSPALPDFYTAARAAAARPRPLCGREGVIAPGFSGTGGVSKGDSVPLRVKSAEADWTIRAPPAPHPRPCCRPSCLHARSPARCSRS